MLYEAGDRVKILNRKIIHCFQVGQIGEIVKFDKFNPSYHERQYIVEIQGITQFMLESMFELANDQALTPTISTVNVVRDLTSKMVKYVDSSTIKSYTYHNKSLIVTFLNGGVYQYLNVPLSTIKQFKSAYSLGSFLADNIKPKFDYIKLA